MPKINKSFVDSLPYQNKGQKLYMCTDLQGFGVYVGRETKTYFAQREVHGKTVRVVIGKHGVFTPDNARTHARTYLMQMAHGINPNKQKQQARQKTITLNDAVEKYKSGRKDLSKSTLYRLGAITRLYMPDWVNTELRDITKDMIFNRHIKLGEERGKTTANKIMQSLRAVYNFAMQLDETLPKNPVSALSATKSWYGEKRRRNVIKMHELKLWHDTVMMLENTTIRDYLIMLLFTGMRRHEAMSLEWKNIDFVGRTILVPQTKNGNPLELPISDHIFSLLQARKKRTGKSPWVFPSKTSNTGYLTEPRKSMDWIKAECGIEFMLHDLRRTFVTIAESLDIPAYAIKALVNHTTGGDITAGYIIMTVDRLREPMQKISNFILATINKTEE